MGKGTDPKRRRTFMGLPIAQPGDPRPDWVVGSRVSDIPRPELLVPGSAKLECVFCAENVWLDPASQKLARQGVRVSCAPCFLALVEKKH